MVADLVLQSTGIRAVVSPTVDFIRATTLHSWTITGIDALPIDLHEPLFAVTAWPTPRL